MDSESRLSKIFIAVRTNFFGIPDEHMTVKYFYDVGYNTLLLNCQVLVKHLPVRIELDRPSTWEAGDEEYFGWLIKHNTMNPIFPSMPHITIPTAIREYHKPPEKGVSWAQNHNTLFLGKKNVDHIDWLKINNDKDVHLERVYSLGFNSTKSASKKAS